MRLTGSSVHRWGRGGARCPPSRPAPTTDAEPGTAVGTRFSPTIRPLAISSAMKRWPKAGSSPWTSTAVSIRWALSQSRSLTGAARQAQQACSENPAGHRDGDLVDGQVCDQRWGHLPLAGEHRWGRTSRVRWAVARRSTSFPCSRSSLRRRSATSSASAGERPSLPAEADAPSWRSAALSQRCRHEGETPKSWAAWASEASPRTGHRDHVTTELDGEGLGHDGDPSSRDRSPPQFRSQPSWVQAPRARPLDMPGGRWKSVARGGSGRRRGARRRPG